MISGSKKPVRASRKNSPTNPDMLITRLYTGDDGESHFEDIDIPVRSAGDIGALSKAFAATGIIFRETTGDYDFSWHNTPCRQFVLMLEGSVEIEVGDGSRRIFCSGDILLAEDTTGRGHVSRAIDGQPRRSVFVTLE
jgi:uncharacterized cupin superfamily protein